MLSVQKVFLNYLKEIENETNKISFSKEINESFDLLSQTEAIRDAELLVPIIGAFSAGKSSLLNSFLGKDYLPVGITPETALATELRFSIEEYIEAVKSNGAFEKYAISDIEEIKNRASEYKFLRMFINNENLRAIEPLILVDMPGFESPLDLHNQAILEYINKGVHYIVLTSVEDGTITRSMVRQLGDIQTYGRDFSFFLSKTNLRAESEVKEIVDTVEAQIQDHFDVSKDVLTIDNNGGDSFRKILSKVDTEALFHSLFISELKDSYYKITEVINTLISTLGKDKVSNEQAISELKKALDDLIKERDRMVNEANEKYTDINVNRIVEAVGSTLSISMDELVVAAMNGGQNMLSQSISEMIRHSLVDNFKNTMGEISNEIVKDFSLNLSGLNKSIDGYSISDDWLNRITESTHRMFNAASSGINNFLDQRNKNSDSTKIYKTITTVLAVTTEALAPILEVVLIFLPDLISGIAEHFQKLKQEKEIRSTISTQIIPSIKRELRSKLPEIFNQQVQEMIVNISSQFEGEIQLKQETIASTQKTLESRIIDIEKEVSGYKKINENISTLANKALLEQKAS
jgi:GTPase SAR1 family protein